MSIIAYTGLPGSGKSYNAVANVIKPAFEAGRRVVTNIPLNTQHLDSLGFSHLLIPFESADFKNEGFIDEIVTPNHGSVFVLDECWRLWPSGTQQKNMPAGHAEWLAEHRHYTGADGKTDEIVLVTQDLSQIAACVRSLVEATYIHRKLSGAGLRSAFGVNVFSSAQTGTGKETALLNSLTGKYQKSVFRWYQSHTHSNSGAGLEQAADRRANVWRSPKLIAALVFGTLAPLIGVYLVASTFTEMAGGGEEPQTFGAITQGGERSEAPRGIAPMPDVQPPPRPVESPRWRITGYFRDARRSLAILEDAAGNTTRVRGCDYSGHGPVCEYQGEIVRTDTGTSPRRQAPGFLERSFQAAGQQILAHGGQ